MKKQKNKDGLILIFIIFVLLVCRINYGIDQNPENATEELVNDFVSTAANSFGELGFIIQNIPVWAGITPYLMTENSCNTTNQNLTLVYQVTDAGVGDNIQNITDWRVNQGADPIFSNYIILNLPMVNGSSNATYSKDYSALNQNLTQISGATYNETASRTGEFGGYFFDGVNDMLNLSTMLGEEFNFNGSSHGVNGFTISLWMRGNFTGRQVLIGHNNVTSSGRGWQAALEQTNGTPNFILNYSSTLNTDCFRNTTGGINVSDYQWHHLVYMLNLSGRFIYVDGRFEYSCLQNTWALDFFESQRNVIIGVDDSSNFDFEGQMDDIIIFNTSLSDQQIRSLFENNTETINIVSEELREDETWQACITPADRWYVGDTNCTNLLSIMYHPEYYTVDLNSTDGSNISHRNLTLYYQLNVSSNETNDVKNITDWRLYNHWNYTQNQSIALLNMPFEGDTNVSEVTDYSSYGNNISTLDSPEAPIWLLTGGYDGEGAYYFRGSDLVFLNEVDSAGNFSFFNITREPNITSFSISVWVNINDTITYHDIVDYYYDESNYWSLYMDTDGAPVFYVNGAGWGSKSCQYYNQPNYRINDSIWHHIVLTVDGPGDVAQIYVDGNREDSVYPCTGWSEFIRNETGNLTIGPWWNGSIDDLIIFNRTLSYEQAQRLYLNDTDDMMLTELSYGDNWYACITPNDGVQDGHQTCSDGVDIDFAPNYYNITLNSTNEGTNYTTDNLTLDYTTNISNADILAPFELKNITDWVLYNPNYTTNPSRYMLNTSFALLNMPFEAQLNASFVKDYSQYGFNGATSGNTLWVANGGYDGFGAYYFDGVNDIINITNTSANAFDFNGSGGNAFSISVWVKGSFSGASTIVAKNSDTDSIGWRANLRTGAYPDFVFYNGVTFSTCYSAAAANVSDNQWHHLVYAYNLTGRYTYVDGEYNFFCAETGFAFNESNFALTIGATPLLTDDFNGYIDELMIFNRSISPEEIRSIFNNETKSMVSGELTDNDVWYACITPNDGITDGDAQCSDDVNITEAASNPDLSVYDENISFDDFDPVEDTLLNISVNVTNLGATSASNVKVQFLNQSVEIGNDTINSIAVGATEQANITFMAIIGTSNITIIVDPDDDITETDETNNNASMNITTQGYHTFYGVTTGTKKLGNFTDAIMSVSSAIENVFAVEVETPVVNFNSLQAIGRKINGAAAANDFTEIDTVLGMTNFNDSIRTMYSSDGTTPLTVYTFNIYDKDITNVPINFSSSDESFVTGILWETTDDDGDLEYDAVDKESLAFVSTNNKSISTSLGVIDYILKVPANLADIKTAPDTSTLNFYIELD